MTFKETTGHLIKAGLVKTCPVDVQAITKLIRRAYLDLRTAKRNLEEDQECTYTYAYNAMLRSGLALMFSEGYRPEIKDKHRTVVRFASAVLGEDFQRLITDYDFMRKKRHQFIYEPDIPCSMTEASEALKTARAFVDQVAELIRAKSPQREFHFGKESTGGVATRSRSAPLASSPAPSRPLSKGLLKRAVSTESCGSSTSSPASRIAPRRLP